jgi:hypothetical protein
VKATLLAPLLNVNADVEFRQQSRADDRGRRSGGRNEPTPDLGLSPLHVHRTTAWDADVPRQSQHGHHRTGACYRRPARARSYRRGASRSNLNESVEK